MRNKIRKFSAAFFAALFAVILQNASFAACNKPNETFADDVAINGIRIDFGRQSNYAVEKCKEKGFEERALNIGCARHNRDQDYCSSISYTCTCAAGSSVSTTAAASAVVNQRVCPGTSTMRVGPMPGLTESAALVQCKNAGYDTVDFRSSNGSGTCKCGTSSAASAASAPPAQPRQTLSSCVKTGEGQGACPYGTTLVQSRSFVEGLCTESGKVYDTHRVSDVRNETREITLVDYTCKNAAAAAPPPAVAAPAAAVAPVQSETARASDPFAGFGDMSDVRARAGGPGGTALAAQMARADSMAAGANRGAALIERYCAGDGRIDCNRRSSGVKSALGCATLKSGIDENRAREEINEFCGGAPAAPVAVAASATQPAAPAPAAAESMTERMQSPAPTSNESEPLLSSPATPPAPAAPANGAEQICRNYKGGPSETEWVVPRGRGGQARCECKNGDYNWNGTACEMTQNARRSAEQAEQQTACGRIENAEWGGVLKKCKCKNNYEWEGGRENSRCVMTARAAEREEKNQQNEQNEAACGTIDNAKWDKVFKKCKCENNYEWKDGRENSECVMTAKAEQRANDQAAVDARREACAAAGESVAKWNNNAKSCSCNDKTKVWDNDGNKCAPAPTSSSLDNGDERAFRDAFEELTKKFYQKIADLHDKESAANTK